MRLTNLEFSLYSLGESLLKEVTKQNVTRNSHLLYGTPIYTRHGESFATEYIENLFIIYQKRYDPLLSP